ncbi:phage holin family protein [Pseudomonas viridiflava]|nr:putative holin [Pseudomonas viridiflava]MCI3908856.1 phage holin family protein [Pseudomonas viridiflava]
MADPTSSTISGLLVGLGLASAAPIIDGDALFGAVLGAWLVTSTKHNLKPWQRVGSLLLSSGVGYLFAPTALRLAPVLTSGGAAFACALLVIPISIKSMVWIERTDLVEILRRIRGGN